MPAYSITGVTVSFPTAMALRPALSDVSFTVGAGELLVVLGRTGLGKTTLLRVLAGLQKTVAGRIQEDCPVTAVLVWDYLSQHHPDGSTTFDPTYDAHRAGMALDSFVAAALGASDAERVDKRLVFDLAQRGMIEASSEATLAVVAARGVGGFKELLLGSVSQRLLHEGACPVAIVRRSTIDSMEPNGRVVVGVDDSDHGQAALVWAAQEAAFRGAQLRVVHTFQPSYVDAPLPTPVDAIDTIHRDGRAVLEQAISNANIGASVDVEAIAATGSPAKALLEACRDADLVVVGRKGRSMLRARLLGSVATQLSHHAPIPAVFVSPSPTETDPPNPVPSAAKS